MPKSKQEKLRKFSTGGIMDFFAMDLLLFSNYYNALIKNKGKDNVWHTLIAQ